MPEEKKTDAVAVWQPREFAGNDLLPIEDATALAEIEGIPELIGRDHVDPDDLVLPALALLQSMSDAVQNDVDEAKPGVFMHTGTEEVLPEGNVRVIIVHHHKGNALFPKEDPRYKDLETCISDDQIEGTVYGTCDDCRKCLDWDNENNLPPLGAQTHHFVALTSLGPVMMRFSRSSYKAANRFISSWVTSRKNLWAHPVVVRILEGSKTLASGKSTKFYHMQMSWQTTEKVPAELQRTAYQLYKEVSQKHETGNLKSNEDGSNDDTAEFE